MPRNSLAKTDQFDYGDLEAPTVEAMEQEAAAIANVQQAIRKATATGVLMVGGKLHHVHTLLAGKGRDGMFRPWVKQRCGFSESTARKAIQAFEAFKKLLHDKSVSVLSSFEPGALYLLSADSCPEEATTEAISRAKKGETITPRVAREIKAKYDPPEDDEEIESPRSPSTIDDNVFLQLSSAVSRWRQTPHTEADKQVLIDHLRLMIESLENPNGENNSNSTKGEIG